MVYQNHFKTPKQIFEQKNVYGIVIKYATGDLSFVEVPSRVTSIFRFAHQKISLPPPPPLNLWLRAWKVSKIGQRV